MKKILCMAGLVALLALPPAALAFLDREQQAAIGHYAEQMISLMQSPAIGFSTDRTLLLKQYLDENDPHYRKALDLYRAADTLLNGMENYAIAVSTLSTTGASEREVIAQLARALEKFTAALPSDIEVSGTGVQERLSRIRQEEKYLDALRVAQPVITGIGRYGQHLLGEYEGAVGALSRAIAARMNDDYRELVEFKDVIDDRRIRFLSRVDTEKPNEPNAEKAAIRQLNQLSRIMTVMQPYLQYYWDTQAELSSVTSDIYLNTARLKLVFLVWVRAHARLVSGVDDEEAFDIMEYRDLIEEAAKFGKELGG